jgi:pimeloyl-ACP methyl ester carboxylesterase
MKTLQIGFVSLFLLFFLFLVGCATTPKLTTESFYVPARDSGIELYVRNKRPEGVTKFEPEKIVLFVHGATYPAESAFDLPLDGMSWMDYIAQRGYDVYLMDVRGYGASTRPPEMSRPPSENSPIVNTDVAVKDVGAVVDYILGRRSVPKINLIGWSWGTSIMAGYTAQNSSKVERLVLYAPVWLRQTPSLVRGQGAYRTVNMESARNRWLAGVPQEKQKDLIPPGWYEAWAKATLATDPVGSAQSPPVVRAPNGVIEDGQKYWSAGIPYYDPSKINNPVLLIHAEWDADTPAYMSQTLFGKLVNAPLKRYVVIGEGTHTVIMEKNRMQLFREVQLFLDEPK